MAFRNKLRTTNEEEPIVELINIDSKNFYGTKTGIIQFAIRDLELKNLKECVPELYFSTHFAVDNNITLRYNENEDLIQLGKAIRAKNMKELRKVCMEGGAEWMAVYLETENFIEDEEHMEEYNLADVYEQEMNDATRIGRKEERESIVKNMHKSGFSLEDVLRAVTSLPKEEIEHIYYSV